MNNINDLGGEGTGIRRRKRLWELVARRGWRNWHFRSSWGFSEASEPRPLDAVPAAYRLTLIYKGSAAMYFYVSVTQVPDHTPPSDGEAAIRRQPERCPIMTSSIPTIVTKGNHATAV